MTKYVRVNRELFQNDSKFLELPSIDWKVYLYILANSSIIVINKEQVEVMAVKTSFSELIENTKTKHGYRYAKYTGKQIELSIKRLCNMDLVEKQNITKQLFYAIIKNY